MMPNTFRKLVEIITPLIEKTVVMKNLMAELRLLATFSFLVNGVGN